MTKKFAFFSFVPLGLIFMIPLFTVGLCPRLLSGAPSGLKKSVSLTYTASMQDGGLAVML